MEWGESNNQKGDRKQKTNSSRWKGDTEQEALGRTVLLTPWAMETRQQYMLPSTDVTLTHEHTFVKTNTRTDTKMVNVGWDRLLVMITSSQWWPLRNSVHVWVLHVWFVCREQNASQPVCNTVGLLLQLMYDYKRLPFLKYRCKVNRSERNDVSFIIPFVLKLCRHLTYWWRTF